MIQSEPKTSPANITVNVLYELPSKLIMWFQSLDIYGPSRTVICPPCVACFMRVHVDPFIIP